MRTDIDRYIFQMIKRPVHYVQASCFMQNKLTVTLNGSFTVFDTIHDVTEIEGCKVIRGSLGTADHLD